MSLNEYEK
jgi:hypothetical protein